MTHDGEALQPVREVTTKFNTKRLNRHDYEFRFQDVGAIGGHSIALLAENLAEQIQGVEASFGYSKESAQRVARRNLEESARNTGE